MTVLPDIVPPIAIDFGTKKIQYGLIDDGQVRLLYDGSNSITTPVVVRVENGSPSVGILSIWSQWRDVFCHLKRMLGKTYDEVVLTEKWKLWPFKITSDGERLVLTQRENEPLYYVEQICAMIFQIIKQQAEAQLQVPVTDLVISVPSIFTDAQRQALINAARLGNWNLRMLTTETTSAVISYLHDRPCNRTRTILAIDWGAGYMTMSVMNVKEKNVQVLATVGCERFGGLDIDYRLLNYVASSYKRRFHVDFPEDLIADALCLCEDMKKRLSSYGASSMQLNGPDNTQTFDLVITRDYFDILIDDIISEAHRLINAVLRDARLNASQITDLVTVGGSTKIPKFCSMLDSIFGAFRQLRAIGPDNAVVYGACIQAAVMSGYFPPEVPFYRWCDVIPASIGLDETGGIFDVIFPKYTAYPTVVSRVYVRRHEDQDSMMFDVYEGESNLSIDNHYIGKFMINDIETETETQALFRVDFILNFSGVIHFIAFNLEDGIALQTDMLKYSLDDEELDEMLNRGFDVFPPITPLSASLSYEHSVFSLRLLLRDEVLLELVPQDDAQHMSQVYRDCDAWYAADPDELPDYDLRKDRVVMCIKPIVARLVNQITAKMQIENYNECSAPLPLLLNPNEI